MTEIEIQKLWNVYYPKVYGYFFRRVTSVSDVEDITSIVLTGFFKTLLDSEKYQKIKNIDNYLWKIAHNQLASFINLKSKQPIFVGLEEEFVVGVEHKTINKLKLHNQTQSIFSFAEKNFNQTDVQILRLNLEEELNSTQIGQKLNMKPATVRQKLKRAISKLMKYKHTLTF